MRIKNIHANYGHIHIWCLSSPHIATIRSGLADAALAATVSLTFVHIAQNNMGNCVGMFETKDEEVYDPTVDNPMAEVS